MSITKFLIRKNIVKNENQANMLMIFVILLCVLYFVVGANNNSSEIPEYTEEELIQMEQDMIFMENDLF